MQWPSQPVGGAVALLFALGSSLSTSIQFIITLQHGDGIYGSSLHVFIIIYIDLDSVGLITALICVC